MVLFSLQIHPSIRGPDVPQLISKDFTDISIIQAIIDCLETYPQMKEMILNGSTLRAGLLVFTGKTELTSMGLLDGELTEELTVRIVPILHGG